MEIKRKSQNECKFGELKNGDVFEYDDSVYIKTDLKRGEKPVGLDANAVNVILGTWAYFTDTDKIKWLSAVLVIKD